MNQIKKNEAALFTRARIFRHSLGTRVMNLSQHLLGLEMR